MSSLSHKKILLGVSGGIAAYKACELASLLVKEGAEVTTILTEHAERFITPLTFKTITYKPVYTDQFDYEQVEPLHIDLAQKSDLVILAPTTADLIAKIAHGICDDLLTTTLCAYNGLALLAPAMNTAMWENPILQKNLETLKRLLNYQVIEPAEGVLACRSEGIGKLAPVEKIFEAAGELFLRPIQSDLSGLRVLVTAGGTREAIDPVRYIGNRSSGKMGTALADEAFQRGAQVTLICTSPQQKPYATIEVESSHQLQEVVEDEFDHHHILIMAAAVSDFRPINFSPSKIKKNSREEDWTLSCTKSPDILGTLGLIKKPGQILIGFAAESENAVENARSKLLSKKLDLIIANEIKGEMPFGTDDNEVFILSPNPSEDKFLALSPKSIIARQIWDYVTERCLDKIKTPVLSNP
ncbi:MAG: bifunctional phosphopantothenoylcysteine decarboxylase/phosphopantothenate--cysteine ligase CoaBC [Candidatus Caenarcaniphilales bacterium]|nr:bifunctional phosphopantothenoylcysteine decarboxylase/phosphopantothenate--cysteine ligase CoaBC [Candidatus Caenarcaniphilales bacterium]